MQVEKTYIEDLLIISPSVFTDNRGYFLESYNKNKLATILNIEFVQDNESLSQKNVLRGLHFQKPPYSQGKLVRVITGSVLDISVDLRKKSPTYGKHFKYILSSDNKNQIMIRQRDYNNLIGSYVTYILFFNIRCISFSGE